MSEVQGEGAAPLHGRRIGVGITGGIAAYKACDFIRSLRRAGATVRVALTRGALQFVTPTTLQSLSGHPVLSDPWTPQGETSFGHLEFARWADIVVVAPATANFLARYRAGFADDALTAALLAFRGTVLLAPAMNTAMWDAPATQDNVRVLRARCTIVGPEAGALADGDVGMGRLAGLEELLQATADAFGPRLLAGKLVLVTAGPTREFLDPARMLTNPSTGRMGIELAAAASELGAKVTLVIGPTHLPLPPAVNTVHVVTATEMDAAVRANEDGLDYFVAAAAVADYRPTVASSKKATKTDSNLSIVLERTPDILAGITARAAKHLRRPVFIGFAAETHEVTAHARDKLDRKGLDFIVANRIGVPGEGFAAETNTIELLGRDGTTVCMNGTKADLARRLWRAWLRPAV